MDSEVNEVLKCATFQTSTILACRMVLFPDKPAKKTVRDATGESSLIQNGFQKQSMEVAY
jgi:hypothetical protein